jgi:glycosyltransferase involved in cell wall biosynthesis
MPNKKKILWISDSPRFSHVGQSRVTRELTTRLATAFDVVIGGYADDAVTPPYVPCALPIRSLTRVRETFDHSNHQVVYENGDMIPKLITETKPDYVIFSHDIWLFPNVGAVRRSFPDTKFIGYITLDGDPPYVGWKNAFYGYDSIVTPSHYSKRVLQDKWFDLDVSVVPYGIDHGLFRPPRQGKMLLKESIYHATVDHPHLITSIDMRNKFTGIFAGHNSNRKNLTAIYWAWKEFEKNKSDVVFYMIAHHASPTLPIGSYPLETFTDLETMVIISQSIEDRTFASMLTASDVLLHPTLGEGFGLPVMESMACGTVPIVPKFSSLEDFCTEENSFLLDWVPLGGAYAVRRAVSVQDKIVEALEKAYSMWKENRLYEEKGKKGIETAKAYTWDACAMALGESIVRLEQKKSKLKGKVPVVRLM